MSSKVYSGTVQRILWSDGDFHILRVVLDGAQAKGASDEDDKWGGFDVATVTAKGNFPAQNILDGSWISFEGRWVNDAKYGKQLQVTRSPVSVQSWTDERVLSALSAHGVGFSTRQSLEAHSKANRIALQPLLDAGDLKAVDGLDEFTQQHTLACWQSLRTYLDAATFMGEAGIPPKVVSKVWSFFGTDIESLITKDPWVLVRVPGISFKEVDEVAERLGVSMDSPGRVRGAVVASVQEIVTEGHVFATTGQIVDFVRTKIPGDKAPSSVDIAHAIKDLVADKHMVADKTTRAGLTAVYDDWHHQTELECAQLLEARVRKPIDETAFAEDLCGVGGDVDDAFQAGASLAAVSEVALKVWAAGHRTKLTSDQMQAAQNALISQVSLLTGLPGTGKTTTLQAVVSVIKDAGVPFLLAAPTGIAAKRMSSVTGSPASTIHRAFGAKGFMESGEEREANYTGITGGAKRKGKAGGSGEWGYGPGNPHPAKFVVVDETSMLDLHMLYRLLTGTSEDCRIMFVGDPYQLPSVGSGDVLRDLVKAGVFPHAHLSQIFRQEDTSGIVLAAHAVHGGKVPNSDRKDFVLIPCGSEEQASDMIVQVALRLYEERRNFQVLSPRHGGDAGVTSLNQKLRCELNPAIPGLRELRLAGSIIREGDRIMVVKNDYEKGTYNGDVGKISRIDSRAKEIEIKIHEGLNVNPRLVMYSNKKASRAIRLAYAQTVHKSQGQEYDVIILPILSSFGRQLQRNLFYTAITRAKSKVFLVGTTEAVARAVRNNRSSTRNTLLSDRLASLLGGVGGAVSGKSPHVSRDPKAG